MNTDAPDQTSLVESLEALRREVASLSIRVATIERTVAEQPSSIAASPTGAGTAIDTPRDLDGPTPEILAVISAALAAYFGLKPHIRQIRILGGGSWAQQGRVRIQASHALTVQRD